jgi:ABC-type Fe3+/spermidine/putrescine transport system ATPase subunit
MSILAATDISKTIKGQNILDHISFEIEKGQRLAIAGSTGSGKTTLLKVLAGMDQADSGVVTFRGERVKGVNEKLLPGHRGIACLSQHFELRRNYRVEELLEYASELEETAASKVISFCRIEHLFQRRSDELSGGERQRVALAMQLLSAPQLLLLDEPYSNLDWITKNEMISIVNSVLDAYDITCIMVSHDGAEVISWADEVILMKEGRIVQRGSPAAVYNFPADQYAASLFGNCNAVEKKWLQDTFGGSANTDTVFIRPEWLRLSTDTSTGTPGIISGKTFHGASFQYVVSVGGRDLVAQTPEAFGIGQQVDVGIELPYLPHQAGK